MSKVLAGVLPVLVTPFDESGGCDAAALANEVDFVISHGAHGVVLGMVSEVLRLSSEERDALTEATCKAVDGRVSVTASVGAESLHTAVRHAKLAESAGADAVMATPPIATSCADPELFRYYATIMESVELPVVVQDASGYFGRPLSIELQADLVAAYGDRAMFKPETQPIGPRLSRLLDATDGSAKVFEGTGGLALVDSYRRGIAGTMPGPDVCWAVAALWDALEANDDDRICQIEGPLCALVSLLTNLDMFVAVLKHLLHRQRVIPATAVRGPVGYTLDAATESEVNRRFDRLARVVNVQV
jgi:dihydrodipicolinate synthase/N-acetylneuraminate lyase